MADQNFVSPAEEIRLPERALPEPNPLTRAAHRREVFWQITLPFVLGALILLAVAALAVWGTTLRSETVNRWGWISLIWMLIPALFFTFIIIAFFAGLVYLLTRALSGLPPYARLIQDFFTQVAGQARALSDKAGEPIIRLHAWRASVNALMRRLRR
jgi:hypothetical protein